MKKIIAVLLFSIFIVAPASAQKTSSGESPTYKKYWENVDTFAKKGLYRSAIEATNVVYKKATTEKNIPEKIKAIIVRMDFQKQVDESSSEKTIYEIENELKNSEFPTRNLLHSVLAELYWNYYKENRWDIVNRTATVQFNNDSIDTWDLKKIVAAALSNYQASLQDADSLKTKLIGNYEPILMDGNARELRPTLYDFLAHRALDFYQNEEPDITHPAYQFELNKAEYFDNASVFDKLELYTQDTFSLKFYALKMCQQLILFHSQSSSSKEIAALLDVDLDRLQFVKQHSESVPNKDSLYVYALRNLQKKYLLNPASAEVSFQLANFYSNTSDYSAKSKNKNTRWNKQKAMALCEAAVKRFPNSFGASNCLALENTIRNKSISFQTQAVDVPEKPFPALITYTNVTKVYFRIVKAMSENNVTYLEEKTISKYAKQIPVKEWAVDLPAESDFQTHSVEVKIPKLNLGHYIILMSANKNFTCLKNSVAYNNCQITNISYIHRQRNDENDYFILNRDNGKPLKNVTVKIVQEKYDYKTRKSKTVEIAKNTSDENGYFHIPPLKNNYYGVNYTLYFTLGKDHFNTVQSLYSYDSDAPKDSTTKTYFFTDRGIYRPGQIVYFKGILLTKKGTKSYLRCNQKTTVGFYNDNEEMISSLDLTSNDYGSVSGSFIAPNSLNGDFSIKNEDGEIDFSIEDYKRPKFEVTLNPVKGNYKLGEKINVSGVAKSYNGSAIDGAKVKYRVVRNASFPSWYWWNSYNSSETQITTGTLLSNDTGGFVVPFTALPDLEIAKNSDPTFTYTIYVDVTDVSGETHSSQTQVSVAYSALDLSLYMPEKVDKQVADTFYISVTNKSGEPQPASVSVKIFKLKEPNHVLRNRLWDVPDTTLYSQTKWDSIFPNDVYLNENDEHTWQKTDTVFNKQFSVPKENYLATSNFENWKQGTYLLEAHTIDKYGQDVKQISYFTLFNSKEKKVAEEKPDLFTALKNNCNPGEKASFLIGSAADSVHVLFEIERKNKISSRQWITLNDEQKIIEIPVEETDRGGFSVHFVFVKNNREYVHNGNVYVSHDDKNLKLSFETFRDKMLPGQKEEWKIKIRGSKGEKVAAEMMATLYDASLDAFRSNDWYFNIYDYYNPSFNWEDASDFSSQSSQECDDNWNTYLDGKTRQYDQLAWINGIYYYERRYRTIACPSFGGSVAGVYAGNANQLVSQKVAYMVPLIDKDTKSNAEDSVTLESGNVSRNAPPSEQTIVDGKSTSGKNKSPDLSTISARSNFNETAFFYPQLATDDSGNVVIKFTLPESTTRWKMMGLAYTKDLQIGQIEKELVTQKKLMITANAPRFFREGDTIQLSAKVSDLADTAISGTAQLFLYDALTMKDITKDFISKSETSSQHFTVKKGQSTAFDWQLIIPKGINAVTYKVVAASDKYSDGEQNTIPILLNSTLVTESMPLPIRGPQTKSFSFDKLISQNNHSSTLRNHSLTLEFTANPSWYAIQALPYLMEYPYECAEQTFDRFYANDIASYIVHSSSKIKAVFDAWKSQSPETFYSNLQKNQELKSLMLEETPWVMDAKDETEQKKRIALLFDLNKMSDEINSAFAKLQKMQTSNGGWPWFPGMEDDRYITQYIISGMGHLDHLGIKNVREDGSVWEMVSNGVSYLDDRINEDYRAILKYDFKTKNDNHLTEDAIQYLYARSFFKTIPVKKKDVEAYDYFKKQAEKFWLSQSNYMQGMIALALNRENEKTVAQEILKSLKENSINSDEMGMYWKNDYSGMYWYQSPIEEHALLIEAFHEINKDEKTVDDLKTWLLKSKQAENWGTTKATAEACYALLLQGTDWLKTEPKINIQIGTEKINLANEKNNTEAGTGYFKKVWQGNDVKPEMGKVEITKADSGISWGAVYWQYFEKLDKITGEKTSLNINKKLFLEKNSDAGIVLQPITESTILHIGDKVKVRIEIRVDRNMDYVQMKDMRASCFEPINVFSAYKYQDGLGYYESTRDAATNFFFDHIDKGTYVFEYPLVVTDAGNFSNGITTAQCMYAPEFTSHSDGIRVKAEK